MQRVLAFVVLIAAASTAMAQTPRQPKVQPGPNEPDWAVILDTRYGLSLFGDLLNPVVTDPESTPGLFRKVGPGPVVFRPEIALGLEVVIRGGWYEPDDGEARPLWSYQYKNTSKDVETGSNLPPPLAEGAKVEFDPGERPFGLWVGNDQFHDRVFSQPRMVAARNARLARQPYKAMIYPYRDKATGKVVPQSYLIGWEYSTNDDFQDVVCRIDNVVLLGEDGKPVAGK